MRTTMARTGGALALATVLVAAGGCAGMGVLGGGDYGYGGYGNDRYGRRSLVLDGEIRSVDHRRGRISVRPERGSSRTIHLDDRTRVRYGRRDIHPTSLERGDLVRVWVDVDRRGDAWAERVEVYQARQDRRYGDGRYDDGRAAPPRVTRMEGVVGQMDLRQGYFTLERGRAPRVVVRLPGRLGDDDERRLERLRRGDRVRVEIVPLRGNEVELVRFR